MNHPVIPAPTRFDADRGTGPFPLRPGTKVACTTAEVAPIVERFCSEVMRRTGLRLTPVTGDPRPDEPAIRIELATADDVGRLPPPLGISPTGGTPPDERYSLTVDAGRVLLRAAEPAGVARGLTTLIQLAATRDHGDAEVWLPDARITDAPRYAWRGLSLDVARRFFTPGEVRRVIDMLALYKLNALHMHLTDDQAWRLPAGRPPEGRVLAGPSAEGAERPDADAPFYTSEDLRALVAYAADRFVTVVPEVDTPGHTSALVQMRPELSRGRNDLEYPPGTGRRAVWLDPELPATFTLVEDVLTAVAGIFPGPYLHIGGDEPWGMPHDLYVAYVRRVRDLVRRAGKLPVGWQESARAGLGPGDTVQYWLSGIALAPNLPEEVRNKIDADLALAPRDIEAAVAAHVPVIASPQSHCYLDVPYAEPPDDPAQAARQARLGLRLYAPMTVAESFDWQPDTALGAGRDPDTALGAGRDPDTALGAGRDPETAHLAGVEAAIWAETIGDFADLTFLLLPRLPGVAQKAWSGPPAATWPDHRDRLAWHGRLWAQDDLTYFRTPAVSWR